jgi:pSer/pThr/pTyr-binding forkhead associated (FHA) protein
MLWVIVGRARLALPTLATSITRARPTTLQVPNGARLVSVGTDRAVVIRDGGVMIGRDRDSDLVVSGPEVSRRHGILRRSVRGYVLTDASRNGTYVNGRRVRGARVLRAGDVLRIGEAEFRFEVSCVTHDVGVTVPEAVTRRLARLQNAVRLVDLSGRLANSWRLRTASALSYLRRLGLRGWSARSRMFRTIWARGTAAWRIQGPGPQTPERASAYPPSTDTRVSGKRYSLIFR